MTLSRLELGFESPWGRHLHQTGDTVECRNCRESPKIKGSRFFIARFCQVLSSGSFPSLFRKMI